MRALVNVFIYFFIDGHLCNLCLRVPNGPEQKSMKTSFDVHTRARRLFDEYFTLQFNTQNAVSAYVVSAIFDHNLITTTRTINSRMLQTWAAADS